MPIADDQDGRGARDQRARRHRLPPTSNRPRNARDETKERERPDASDPLTFLHASEVEASLDSDKQPAGDGGTERERKCVPVVQSNTSMS